MVINPVVYDEKGKGNDVFSSNLENRVIHLVGEITEEMAASITAQLLHLASRGEEDIQMYINSPGGSVSAGLAIYDTMQYIRSDVCTICIGLAASMGAFLLAGGTKGKRFALPNSEIMIHQPLGGTEGQATDIQIAARHIQKTKDKLNTILSENSGQPYEQVCLDTDRDNWMSAAEAKDYGLIDAVLEKR